MAQFRGGSLFDVVDMSRGDGDDPEALQHRLAFEKVRGKKGRWVWQTGCNNDATDPVRDDALYDGSADHLAIQS